MDIDSIFKRFCHENGYTGSITFKAELKEYHIVITKGENNAGAFLTEQEYQDLTDTQLIRILELLHKGFQEKFNK